MKIQQTIEGYIESITVYQTGLLELLHCYALLNKKEHYQLRIDFIKEVILCSDYLTVLYDAQNKIMPGASNAHMRSVEEFIGAQGSAKKTFPAIT